jgi:hypothetical protein
VHRVSPQAAKAPGEALAAAYASADLLLTLVTLDPSLGSEYLATWAADAVVIVTAGRSSWEKLHGVGEMIRLSGARLVSAVLLGADSTDQSLGTPQTPNRVAPDRPGLLLTSTPAPAETRPSRGLRPGRLKRAITTTRSARFRSQ